VSFVCAGTGSVVVSTVIGTASHRVDVTCSSGGSKFEYNVHVEKDATGSVQRIEPSAETNGFAGYTVTPLSAHRRPVLTGG
jgi:hypothetical protein